MKLAPILLALFTFVAVYGQVSGTLSWSAIVALGPLGIAAFAFGYAIDLLIIGLLVRSTARSHRRAKARRHEG